MEPSPSNTQPPPEDLKAFLDTFHTTVGADLGISRAQTELLYRAFCNHMLDRLLNHEAPVPLLFATLHRCPYRLGWKETLRNRLVRRRTPRPEWDAYTTRTLCSPHVVNILGRPFHYVLPHLEIVATPAWYKLADKVERARHQALGPITYARLVLSKIIRQAPFFAAVFARWRASADRSFTGSVQNAPGGGFWLMARRPHEANKGDYLRIIAHLAPALLIPLPVPKARRRRSKKFPFGPLPPLPPVQPPTPDLRDPRPLPP